MTPGRLSRRGEFTPVPSHGSTFVYYELFFIPRLDGVIHNSLFLTPNVHYSFSFKFRYSLINYSLLSFHPEVPH